MTGGCRNGESAAGCSSRGHRSAPSTPAATSEDAPQGAEGAAFPYSPPRARVGGKGGEAAPSAPSAPGRRLPAWLAEQVREHSRTARLRLCPTCHAPTLYGLDADRAALHARADVDPVTRLGEFLALAAGRASYNLRLGGGKAELDRRDRHAISGPRKYPVVVSHECGQPPVDIEPLENRQPKATENGEIPF